jgi:hypothetical protein
MMHGSRRTKTVRSVALPHRSRFDEVAAICRSQVRTTSDSRHWLTDVPEVGRTSASDAVEIHQSDLVLDALCDRQPVQRIGVAECRRDVKLVTRGRRGREVTSRTDSSTPIS